MKSNHSQDIKNSTAIGGTALKTSFTAQYVYGRKYQIRIWKKISNTYMEENISFFKERRNG